LDIRKGKNNIYFLIADIFAYMKMETNYVTIKINQYILLIRLKIKSATDKPKGVVDTRDIQKVTSTGKTEFCFEIPNHKFELKADTEAIK
jgi:predicted transport protein